MRLQVERAVEFYQAVAQTLLRRTLGYRRERQAGGIRVARTGGLYSGRKSGTTKAIPKRALELRNRGLKIPEIASALNVSERSVFRYLTGNSPNHSKS